MSNPKVKAAVDKYSALPNQSDAELTSALNADGVGYTTAEIAEIVAAVNQQSRSGFGGNDRRTGNDSAYTGNNPANLDQRGNQGTDSNLGASGYTGNDPRYRNDLSGNQATNKATNVQDQKNTPSKYYRAPAPGLLGDYDICVVELVRQYRIVSVEKVHRLTERDAAATYNDFQVSSQGKRAYPAGMYKVGDIVPAETVYGEAGHRSVEHKYNPDGSEYAADASLAGNTVVN